MGKSTGSRTWTVLLFLIFFLAAVAHGAPEKGPILIDEDFESSPYSVMLGGTNSVGTCSGSEAAILTDSGVFTPRLPLHGGAWVNVFADGSGCSTAPSTAQGKILDVHVDGVVETSHDMTTSREFYGSFVQASESYIEFRQDDPNDGDPSVDDIYIACRHVGCYSDKGEREFLNEEDFDTAPGSGTTAFQDIDFSGGPYDSGGWSTVCPISPLLTGTEQSFARVALALGEERSYETDNVDLTGRRKDVLEFDLFISQDTSCTQVPQTENNCDACTESGTPVVLINEVVLTHSDSTGPLWAAGGEKPCDLLTDTGVNGQYLVDPSAFSSEGRGIELVAEPGINLAGYVIDVLSMGKINDNLNTRPIDNRTAETDPRGAASELSWISEIILPANTIVESPATRPSTGDGMGYVTIPYDFRNAASCVLYGSNNYPGGCSDPNLSNAGCFILLWNPSKTELLHIFGMVHNHGSTVRIPWVDSGGTSCIGADACRFRWTALGGPVGGTPHRIDVSVGGTDDQFAVPQTSIGLSMNNDDCNLFGNYEDIWDGSGDPTLYTPTLYSIDDNDVNTNPDGTDSTTLYTGFQNVDTSDSEVSNFNCASVTPLLGNGCCAVTTDDVYLAGHTGSNPDKIIARFPPDHTSGEWRRQRIPIPEFLQNANNAKFKWYQTAASGEILEGEQVWAIAKVRVTNWRDVASASLFGLVFSGPNGAAYLQDWVTPPPTDRMTLTFWLKAPAGLNTDVISHEGQGSGNAWSISIDDDQIVASMITDTVPFVPDEWNFVTLRARCNSCGNSRTHIDVESGGVTRPNNIFEENVWDSNMFDSTKPIVISTPGLTRDGTNVVLVDDVRLWSSDLSWAFNDEWFDRPLVSQRVNDPVDLSTLVNEWLFDEGACGQIGGEQSYLDGEDVCWGAFENPKYLETFYMDVNDNLAYLPFQFRGQDFETDPSSWGNAIDWSNPTSGKVFDVGATPLEPGSQLNQGDDLDAATALFSGYLWEPNNGDPPTAVGTHTLDYFVRHEGKDSDTTAVRFEIIDTSTTVTTNNPPTALGKLVYLLDSSKITIDLTVADADGTQTNAQSDLFTDPSSGDLETTNGGNPLSATGTSTFDPVDQVDYTPIGWDSFTNDLFAYQVTDTNTGETTPPQDVTLVRRMPRPVDDTGLTATAGVSKEFNVLANDYVLAIDQPTLKVAAISTGPSKGSASLHSSNKYIRYTPAKDATGTDSLTYTVSVEIDGSTVITSDETAQLNITITASGTPLVANDDSDTTLEDTDLVCTLVASGGSGSLYYKLATPPTQGKIIYTDNDFELPVGLAFEINEVTYRPDPDYNGSDNFFWTVEDGSGNIATGEFSITVDADNDAPIIDPAKANQRVDPLGTPVTVVLPNANDVDGDSLTYFFDSVVGIPPGAALTDRDGVDLTGVGSGHILPDGEIQVTAEELAFASPYFTVLWYVEDAEFRSVVTAELAIDTYFAESTSVALPEEFLGNTEDTPIRMQLTYYDPNNSPTHSFRVGTIPDSINEGTLNEAECNTGTPGNVLAVDDDFGNTCGQIWFEPVEHYVGTLTFEFYVNDDDGTGKSAEVTIEYLNQNDPPVATAQVVETDEEVSITFTLDITDPDVGDTFFIDWNQLDGLVGELFIDGGVQVDESTSMPLDNELNYEYVPALNFNGQEIISYTATDAGGLSTSPTTVTFNVDPVNDPPIAQDISGLVMDEEGSLSIELSSTDPDRPADTVVYVLKTNPTKGQVFSTDGAGNPTGPAVTTGGDPDFSSVVIVYTGSTDEIGSDSFTYAARDGDGVESDPATVSITINNVNDPPVASAVEVTLNEGDTTIFSLTCTDPDGDTPLSFSVDTLLSPSDGGGELYEVASDGTTVGNEVISAGGIPSQYLQYRAPPSGVTNDYTNIDPWQSFSFRCHDPSLASSAQRNVDITVTDLNDIPSAIDFTVSTDEGVSVTFSLLDGASDPDFGDSAIEWSVQTSPTTGTLSRVGGTPPTITEGNWYTEDLEYDPQSGTGERTFTYKVRDTQGGESAGTNTVTLAVGVVNDAPTAEDQSISVDEEQQVVITLTVDDPDSTSWTFFIEAPLPSRGLLYDVDTNNSDFVDGNIRIVPYELIGNKVAYQGRLDEFGSDSFFFSVEDDGGLKSAVDGEVTVTIDNVNDPPTAKQLVLVVDEETPMTVDLSDGLSDPDPVGTSSFTYYIMSTVDDGLATLEDSGDNAPIEDPLPTPDGYELQGSTVDFQSLKDVAGQVPFSYRIVDQDGDISSVANVIMVVYPVNNPPQLDGDLFRSLTENSVWVEIDLASGLTDSDSSGPFTGVIMSLPTNGVLGLRKNPTDPVQNLEEFDVTSLPFAMRFDDTVTTTTIYYTPDVNYVGADSFVFAVEDEHHARSSTATVQLTITNVNYAPTVEDVELVIDEDESVTITLEASDADDDIVRIEIRSGPLTGTLTPQADVNYSNDTYLYTPSSNLNGADTDLFQYAAVDSRDVSSAVATVTVDITARGDRPQCRDLYRNVQENDDVLISLLAGASNEPDSSNNLPSTFKWKIVQLPPYGTLKQSTGSANPPGNAISVVGTNLIDPGMVWYFGELNVRGANVTQFQYLVIDQQGLMSESCEVVLDIEGFNTDPVALSVSAQTEEDRPLTIQLLFTDADPLDSHEYHIEETVTFGGVLRQYVSVEDPEAGDIIQDGDILVSEVGLMWFLPESNYFCDEGGSTVDCPTFKWFVTDQNDGTTGSQTVQVVVTSVNDPPSILPEYIEQTFNIFEDERQLLPLLEWATDPESTQDELLFRIKQEPIHGNLHLSNSSGYEGFLIFGIIRTGYILYVPNENVNDVTDSFIWSVEDDTGREGLTTGKVTYNIRPKNDPPTVFDSRVSLRQSSRTQVTLTAQDVDGNSFRFLLSRLPDNGVVYQYDGFDPVENRPIKGDQIRLSNPVITDANNRVVYEPIPRLTGQPFDSFRYVAVDYNDDDPNFVSEVSDQAVVTVDVLPNNPPKARSASWTGQEDEELVIELTGTDQDGDRLSALIASLPLFGRLYQAEGSGSGPFTRGEEILSDVAVTNEENRVIFVPDRDEFGSPYDEFSFRVFDGDDISKQDAKIEIIIEPVQDEPISRDIGITQDEDDLIAIILSGVSPDGGAISKSLKAEIMSLPTRGNLWQNRGLGRKRVDDDRGALIDQVPTLVLDGSRKVLYQSNKDTFGEDQFSYRVFDDSQSPILYSSVSTVFLEVTPVNDAPVAYNVSVPALESGVSQVIVLNATDVDNSDDILQFRIRTTADPPNQLIMSQVFTREDGSTGFEEIVVVPATVTDSQGRIAVDPNVAEPTDIEIEYVATDGVLFSEPAFIKIDALPSSASSDSSSNIGLIAGVVGGLVGGLLLCCLIGFFWWRRKRAREKHSMADAMLAKKSSKEILEKLLLEQPFTVVCALSDVIEITEADELASALVNLFVAQPNNEIIMSLLQVFISKEVQGSKNPSTLFRGNSLASKMMKAYSRMIGIGYLRSCLPELINEVLSNPGAYEVDTRKLTEDANLDANWELLTDTTNRFFEAIVGSLDECPIQFRQLCNYLHGEVTAHFPDYGAVHTFIGGFLFLRFFCPAIVAPESYQIVDEVPSMQSRRGLVLVSKGIQNLSNNVQFGSKEEYMMRMNAFIVGNLRKVKEFLEEVACLPDPEALGDDHPRLQPVEANVEASEKLMALDTLHRHLFVNQNAVVERLRALGVSDDGGSSYLEHLAALDLVLSYNESHTEEITEVFVSDLPLVFALAATLDHTAQSASISKSLITVFEAHGLTVQLLRDMVKSEIDAVQNANMLLRGNSTALRLTKGLVMIIGLPYLQQTLGTLVTLVVNEPEGYEISQKKLPPGENLDANIEKLKSTIEEFLNAIFSNAKAMPIQIRVLCKAIHDSVANSPFSDKRVTVLGDLVFSRIICPAIYGPVAYGLVDDSSKLSPKAQRALTLITKTISNLAHGVSIEQKTQREEFMSHMSEFIKANLDKMQDFLEELIDVPEDAADDAQNFLITNELLVDSVATIHRHLKENEERVRKNLTPDMRETGSIVSRLVAILEDLGPPIEV